MTQTDPVDMWGVQKMWKNLNPTVIGHHRGVTPEVSHRIWIPNALVPKEIGSFPPFHRPYDYDCLSPLRMKE